MKPLGSDRYLSRFSLFQTSPSLPCCAIDSEYLNPSTVPAVRPITPCNEGPTRLVGASMTWHALHLAKIFAPLAASCAVAEPAAASVSVQPIIHAFSILPPVDIATKT